MNHFSSICVYCGASEGQSAVFMEAAQALGVEIAQRGWSLVYGGGSAGLMGAVARAVRNSGGAVTGVIPKPLMGKELSGGAIGELIVVDSMHTRKATMADLGDAFVALPGGFGTLEELFETLAWAQIGIHRKPVGLLNVAGYYDPLVTMIHQGIASGFIRPSYKDLLVVDADPKKLLDRLQVHEPPASLVQWHAASEA
jgi:hypothetical protein